MSNKYRFRPLLCVLSLAGAAIAQDAWNVSSPDNALVGTVQLVDHSTQAGYPAGVRLYYSVNIVAPAFSQIVPPAPLGITRQDQSFVDGLVFDSASAVRVIDETYTLVTGKRRVNRNHANERSLYFRNGNGARLQLVIRAYNDGFAFRYIFPETNSGAFTVTGEATGFRVPLGGTGWMMPQQPHGEFAPGYEDVYRQVSAGASSPGTDGWSLPALFRTPGGSYAFFGETDVGPNYAGTRLQQSATNSVYRIRLPNPNEGNGTGLANPSWTLPWVMPWRFVIAGTNPGVILESAMATNLAAPSTLTDVSWIQPGRSSWSWYSAEASPRNYSQMLPFIDLAQQMGWEYHLVDATWDRMTGGTLPQLIAYGAARNVKTLAWYNGGGPNNTLSPTDFGPRDKLFDSASRQAEFQMLEQAGVKGIKVDFFHSDKQNIIKYYHDLMRDAAKYHLMINFHGCTIQRGWQRTYPNLMTTESVRGAEMYKYDAAYPAQQPARNTMLPFTRNVMGGMDYTPVTFTNYTYAHGTTYAHQLALTVVFESGILHLPDRVTGYAARPDSVKAFLRDVPVVWDETRYLQGEPGTYVAIARRHGHNWWIAGVNGQSTPQALTQNLAVLGTGNYALMQLGDNGITTFTESLRNVTSADSLTVSMLAKGGFSARLIRLDPPAAIAPVRRKTPNILHNKDFYDVVGRRLAPDPVTGKLGPVPALPRSSN